MKWSIRSLNDAEYDQDYVVEISNGTGKVAGRFKGIKARELAQELCDWLNTNEENKK